MAINLNLKPINFSKQCFINFQKDEDFGHYKLKWFTKNQLNPYLPFQVPDGIIEFVDENEFLMEEPDKRFPLFLGSQFGIFPKPQYDALFCKGAFYVILSKSMLSGLVNGLELVQISEGAIKTIKKWS